MKKKLVLLLVESLLIRSEHLTIIEPNEHGSYSCDESNERGEVSVVLHVDVLNDADQYVVCLQYDRGPPECLDLPLLIARDGSIRITNVLPGQRTLSATLSNATSGEPLSIHATQFWMLGNRAIDLTAPRSVDPSPWDNDQMPSDHSRSPSRAQFFDEIYEQNFWVSSGDTSSGPGSNLDVTTPTRKALEEVLSIFSIQSMVDIPCGDMTWLENTNFPEGFLERGSYLGADISPFIISQNRQRLQEGRRGWRFVVADAVEGSEFEAIQIHGSPPDLVLCRHMMFHLPPNDNLAALRRFEASGAKYLLLTTYLRADDNERDYELARGHAINLFRQPYCLRDPLRLYPDNGQDVFLGLWVLPAAFPENQRPLVPPLLGSTCL